MKRMDTAIASGAWWSWGSSNSTATAFCTISVESKPMQAEFRTNFIISPTGPDYSSLYVRLDNKTDPKTLTTGLSLLEWQVKPPTNGNYDLGSITLFPNNISDITSLDFFNFTFYFQSNTGGLFYPGSWNAAVGWETQNMSAWVNGGGSDIDLQVDGFAKAFYSVVLLDLGQTTGPNALTNATALKHLLAVENDMYWLPWAQVGILSNTTGLAYDGYSSQMGPLGTKPASIYQQYACSVPQQKSPGSLIISIVIADLVFLQVLFPLLNKAATY